MKLFARGLMILMLCLSGAAGSLDRDLDNDGRRDFDAGGADWDIDNDVAWTMTRVGATATWTTTTVEIDAVPSVAARSSAALRSPLTRHSND